PRFAGSPPAVRSESAPRRRGGEGDQLAVPARLARERRHDPQVHRRTRRQLLKKLESWEVRRLGRSMVGLLLAFIAIPALAEPAIGQSGLQVDFQLQPNTTLPGIPVSLHFSFSNTTPAPLRLPRQLVLLVRGADGNVFAAAARSSNEYPPITVSEWSDDLI